MPTDALLTDSLARLVELAYPQAWSPAWCDLPLPAGAGSPYRFAVMCADLPEVRGGARAWPPASRDPDVWLRWRPAGARGDGGGFWLRPRRRDPILRERLVLLEPRMFDCVSGCATITAQGVLDACRFAVASGYVVWHNPPKGGARVPHSGHFQALPLRRPGGRGVRTLPGCACAIDPRGGVRLIERGLDSRRYPVLGMVVGGTAEECAGHVWAAIHAYDEARACNLILEPRAGEGAVRAFVFPRRRDPPRFALDAAHLRRGEELLLRNSSGGEECSWSFAGVETGLLTQVEWGPLFDAMRAEPARWGAVLLRVLRALTLDERDDDWRDFAAICEAVH